MLWKELKEEQEQIRIVSAENAGTATATTQPEIAVAGATDHANPAESSQFDEANKSHESSTFEESETESVLPEVHTSLNSSASAVSAPIEAAEKQIIDGRFELISLLGTGGSSKVYKAIDTKNNETIALKLITEERLKEAKNVERFRQEADVFTFLSHENIAAVKEFGTTQDGSPFLVMDYIDGITLHEMLQQEGAINPARAINIILQLCDAMKQAHDNGVIHRDLKPSNVIISRDKNGNETAKILDFGIARVFDQISSAHMPLTETGEMLGTPWYMSPEQCFGQMMDLRSDIYQIGCLLFELLTGKRAFDGTTAFEVMYKHVTGLPNMDDVLPEMQKILAKTLDKNPEERYSSVSELSKELAALPLDELTQGKLPAAVAASKFWESESLGQLVWRRTFAAGIDALMIATISAFIILCLASTKLFATWDMTIPMVVHRTQATFGLGLIDSIFPWVSIVTSIVPDRFLSWDSGLRDIFNGIHWLWNNSIAWSPLTVLIVHWLYSAGFECSRLRGTPGKILLGLKVRSTISSKLTFMQTSRRHFAKAITSLLLPGVVRFFNGVLRKGAKSQLLAQVRRPIHDKLSECVVTRAKRRKEPLITAIAVSLLALIAAVPSAPWLACDLQKYDLAIALNHDMLPAYELRANHNVTSGKFKEAIKDLDFVLKKNPAQFRAYDTLAAIYYQMGDFNKAIDVCKTGIEQCKDRDRPALRQDIIEILLGEKKYSEAAAIFNDLSENDVDSILRASVYDQLHDPAASSLHWNLAKNSAASSVRWMDEDNNGKWVHERPESFLNDAIVNDAIGNSARATKSCLRSISDCEGMEKNTLESQKGWSYTDYTHGSAALLRGKQLLRESNEVAANAFFRTAINHYSKYLEKLEKDKGATTLSYVKFHGRALLGRAAAYEKLQMFEQAAKDRAAATKLGVFLDSHFSYPDWHT